MRNFRRETEWNSTMISKLENCWFQFCEKNQNQRTTSPDHFQKRIVASVQVSWNNKWFSGWLFDSSNSLFLRTVVLIIYQNQVFQFVFGRITVLNPETCPGNCWCLLRFLISTHPTLVSTLRSIASSKTPASCCCCCCWVRS